MILKRLAMMAFTPVFCVSIPAAAAEMPTFESIYEPSGVVYVGGNEFIVVGDEPERPLHRIRLDEHSAAEELDVLDIGDLLLNDLEGVAWDGRYLYAVTSHSLTKKGKIGKGRQEFVRFEYRDGTLSAVRRITDFKNQIIEQFRLASAGLSATEFNEQINIEALAWSPGDQSLYVGLRGPLIDGNAAVFRVHNTQQMFEQQSAINMQSSLLWLDLEGKGIRSMVWDQEGERFLIVAGGKKSVDKEFDLWAWSPGSGQVASRVDNLDTPVPKGTEGMTIYPGFGQLGILLVLDDGSKNQGRPAHYLILPPL